ncbi:MAG: indolepyruvate ferredoxin oxidoreductase [Frankiales bacterium]|jgi:indolepyruvate ferredoxin oxidoreductase|nr:indolepyruvate ferredoxin oxidoreductase [Frankiales bacterium]
MTLLTTADTSAGFSLEDRYRKTEGTIYVTGIQALVRTILDRARIDRALGADHATFVSGYEGSPLAGLDMELERHADLLREHCVTHLPALNEELAATAVFGSQLAGSVADLRYSGVTGFWYGKAPGLDRATDAFRHANMGGTDGNGGAVAFVGDDPAAKSSSIPCSSEFALADLVMPTFFPADPGEVLLHGLHAVELSRASGLWSAVKVNTVVADGASTATDPHWVAPDLSDLPGGLVAYGHKPSAHLLLTKLAELEQSMHRTRLPIALEYIRRSGLNRISGARDAQLGIAASGSTYLAVRQALAILGLDDEALDRRGIRLLKLGVIFPLEPSVVIDFATGLEQIVVVEDKRSFIEDAVKSILYGRADMPAVQGKRNADGTQLFSGLSELDSDAVATALAPLLARAGVPVVAPPRPRTYLPLAGSPRQPFFCSGCPHNSSTQVVPGSLVGGGIGCHTMLLLMPGERTGEITGITQMGGEGGHWIGMAPFVTQRHLVQNLGDGTFAHSGSLAVRAAVAAGANVTFKLLRNSAVAMTGGQQPVGERTLAQLVALLRAEGVAKIIVTTDDTAAVRRQLGRGEDVRHRDRLLEAQSELAAVPGVTVLIHDQECAAEKRRKRRRGKMATPAQRVLINERVCEGCGDCGKKSNCLSVHPVDTEFGRKTTIDQSSCNLDFSCLSGDCPSFLTIVPGTRTRSGTASVAEPAEPQRVVSADQFSMRIVGIGGTGVVTLAQIIATAAAIEGRHVRSLDQTGLAQKGGAVVSDLSIRATPWEGSAKLAYGTCDLYLAADLLAGTDPVNLSVADPARTVGIASTTQTPTGAVVTDVAATAPDGRQQIERLQLATRQAYGIDAAALAVSLLGDEQYANVMLLGAAYQAGAVPVGAHTIEAAIQLNGIAVEANIAAFRHGRNAVANGAEPVAAPAQSVDDLLRTRAADLVAYQNPAYAQRYLTTVERVRAYEADLLGGTAVTEAVARYLYKLMAYKDEYEVARLSLAPALTDTIEEQFGKGARYAYRLHPPVLRALGVKHKISLGPWFRPAFHVLFGMRRLRGTPFDPFGRTEVRRVERALIRDYLQLVDEVLARLSPNNQGLAIELLELPDLVRGYEQIKLDNVEIFHARKGELLEQFLQSA